MGFLITLSIAAVFLGSPRGTQSIVENPVDTVRTFRIIVLVLMGGASFWAVALKGKRAGASGSLIWMVVYSILAMFSAAYSKFPLLSLYKGLEVAAFVALGMYVGSILYSWKDIEDTINIVLLAFWYLIISALVGAVVAPSLAWGWGESGDWMSFTITGVFPVINANTLTQLGGIVASAALCRLFCHPRGAPNVGELLVFFTAVTCMVLSHSRTSLFAFILGAGIILFFYRKKKVALISMLFAGVGSLFFAVSEYLVEYFLRGQTVEGFTSMSGRTHFWPLVTQRVSEAPILGHGFYASQRVLFGVSSVDQAYLEVLLGLGIIGLTVFCVAVLSVLVNLWRSRPPVHSRKQDSDQVFIWTQLVVIFLFIFIRSLTGPSFQNLHINLTLFVLVTVGAAAVRRLAKESATVQEEGPEVAVGEAILHTGRGPKVAAQKGHLVGVYRGSPYA